MIRLSLHLCFFVTTIEAAHYKGGTITWKPTDPYTNSSTVQVIFYQSHSWTLSRLNCDQTLIDNLGPYLDGGYFSNEPQIACKSSASACTASGFVLINQPTCTPRR